MIKNERANSPKVQTTQMWSIRATEYYSAMRRNMIHATDTKGCTCVTQFMRNVQKRPIQKDRK